MVEQIGHRETEGIPSAYPEGGEPTAERGVGSVGDIGSDTGCGQDNGPVFEHDAPGEVQ